MAEDVRPLAAALTESHVVVLEAWREGSSATLFVATRASLGVRSLCESLERVHRQLGSGSDGIWMKADARGCTNLGMLYMTGQGVTLDEARGATLFGRGCDAGSALGCGNLGSAYEAGKGVARDHARAEQLRQRACDGGVKAFCASGSTVR